MAVTEINPDYHLPFANQSIRRGLMCKVYLILISQLLVTFAVADAIFGFFPEVKDFAHRNIWIFWLSGIIMVVTILAMDFFEIERRQTSKNFICLGIFTFARSFLLCVETSHYADNKVLSAIGTTVAICLSLTLFAMQTKWDLTVLGNIVIYANLIFDLFSILFGGRSSSLTYSSPCAFLASFNLIYVTQLMMGSNYKYVISQEKYIFATRNLYFHILDIFIFILGITEE